jgi:formylglycine-generating enzyme required for sulfatase activity
VWPLLRHSPDPSRRTYLIHGLARLETDPDLVLRRLEIEPEVSARRALLVALGGFDRKQLPPERFRPAAARVLQWYRADPDAGVHSAAEWLLRRWGQQAEVAACDAGLKAQPPDPRRQWFVNGQGQTLVILRDPAEFRMGSPDYEPGRLPYEGLRRTRIPRSFAIATREVTVEQFQRFRKDHPRAEELSPRPDGPINNVSWFDAAAYCNWLSAREGIPRDEWVYPEGFGPGMKLPADCLARTGYRLPSEAEWEYACRAGATTSRFYGTSDDLLTSYAWYTRNTANESTRPVGLLRPNDWGLFDTYGNVLEWCLDRGLSGSEAPADGVREDRLAPEDRAAGQYRRGLRSSSFYDAPVVLRSARRTLREPASRDNPVGMRLARTYP